MAESTGEMLESLPENGYRTSRLFVESQLLLGARLLREDGITMLRYPRISQGVLCIDGKSLDDGAKRSLFLSHLSRSVAVVRFLPHMTRGDAENDFVFTLGASPEASRSQFSKSANRALRQGERHGLTIERYTGKEITPEVISAFYAIYTHRMDRFGSPSVPREYLAFLAKDQRFTMLLVRKDDDVIAGATLVLFKGELFNELVASHKDALDLRPNNILYWQFILEAHRLGASTVNYGPSPAHSSVARFKESMGGRPRPAWIVVERYPRITALARSIISRVRSVR